MKLYTNKDYVMGFTKKTRGYSIEDEIKRIGATKAKIGIDTKLLRRALKEFRGRVEIRICKNTGCPKALLITNGKKTAFIAEWILYEEMEL